MAGSFIVALLPVQDVKPLFLKSTMHTLLSILLLGVNRIPLKVRAGFPLVVMNSMVDCNEHSS